MYLPIPRQSDVKNLSIVPYMGTQSPTYHHVPMKEGVPTCDLCDNEMKPHRTDTRCFYCRQMTNVLTAPSLEAAA